MRPWLVVLLLAAPCLAMAVGLGFLRNAPVRHFDREDMNLMMKNAGEVLDSTVPNASRDWSNPRTGNSGQAEVRDQFIGTDGAPCKRLRISNKVKRGNVRSDATYTVCKYTGRGWLLHADARPM